jgi:uncharacterized membrane protein YhfC
MTVDGMPAEEYERLQRDREDEHNDYIESKRALVAESLSAAVGHAGNALYNVRHLSSDQVYDVEYAESGGTVERLVEQAQDLLVAALAMARAVDQ